MRRAGKHVLFTWGQYHPYELSNGENWDAIAEREADKLYDLVCQYAPNMRGKMIARHIQTPLEIERTLGLLRANVMHLEMSLDQMFMYRPLPELSRTTRCPACPDSTSPAPARTRAAACLRPAATTPRTLSCGTHDAAYLRVMTESAAAPVRRNEQHIPFLDHLRGLAILLVFLFHGFLLGYANATPPAWSNFLPFVAGHPARWLLFPLASGWVGVAIFFVVSGFCIHLSHVRSRDRGRPTPPGRIICAPSETVRISGGDPYSRIDGLQPS